MALILGATGVAFAQMGGGFGGGMGGGIGNVPGTAYGGFTDPSIVQITDGFRVIPAVTMAERYDSNVFYAPKTPGLDRSDFVTTVTPQIRGLYAGSLVSINATAGAIGEYYAKNSGLSYVGTNVGGFLDLSKLLDRWRTGSRLTIGDTYMYTPRPPSFLTGDLDGEGSNPLVRGYQVGRVNMQFNNFTATGSVPINPIYSVTASYMNGFQRYGSSDVQQIGALVGLSYQTYTAGIAGKVTPTDTVTASYLESRYDQGTFGNFTTRGGTVTWMHQYTRSFSSTVSAGGQLLKGEFGGVSGSSSIAPTGTVTVMWKERATSVTMTYFLGVSPSFQFESQALLTHVVSAAVSQQLGNPDWLGFMSVNYARGDQYGGSTSQAPVTIINGQQATGAISYVSVGGNAGILYKITPSMFANFSYNYSNYDNAFGGQRFAFDQHIVQLGISKAFY